MVTPPSAPQPETATDRQPSVGVMLPRDLPADQVLPFVRTADELGFAEVWVVEDLGFRGAIAQAATALAATERIRVGMGILPVAARNVGFAAMELGTLAELFPGRVDVGLGHGLPGWMRQVGAWPSSPLTLLREQTAALRALLAGETVTVDGRYVSLSDVRLESPPAVPPPLLAGVRGPRSLALAGEIADGVILAEPVTPEYLRTALAQVGGGPDLRVISYNVALVGDDRERVRAQVRPALEWIGEPDWAVHTDPLPFAEEFRTLRAASATRAEFVERLPDAWVDLLSVSGPVDVAHAQLRAQAAAGVTDAVLMPAGPDPLATLQGLGRLV